MSEYELGKNLRKAYDESRRNEAALAVHLFGITHGEEILEHHYSIQEIVKVAEIGKGYAAELSKGIKLSKYVEVKKQKVNSEFYTLKGEDK